MTGVWGSVPFFSDDLFSINIQMIDISHCHERVRRGEIIGFVVCFQISYFHCSQSVGMGMGVSIYLY